MVATESRHQPWCTFTGICSHSDAAEAVSDTSGAADAAETELDAADVAAACKLVTVTPATDLPAPDGGRGGAVPRRTLTVAPAKIARQSFLRSPSMTSICLTFSRRISDTLLFGLRGAFFLLSDCLLFLENKPLNMARRNYLQFVQLCLYRTASAERKFSRTPRGVRLAIIDS